ncbi:rhamnogalacturonan acetylesterase [Streptomyces sp. NPDC005435]|uniref:rhamnogalacturonan acetylesterase n=1 Tax=Streptomyces sp. NPDC005435 TaxID=3154464 RepID=UPI003453F887
MTTPRIFLTGDSGTAGRRRDEAPLAGWGQALPLFLTRAEVVNSARPGASSRTFVESGDLAAVLDALAPGDLLLACFGLNDVHTDDPRGTEPFGDYQRALRTHVHGARDRGAHPVLVTSHERRLFDDQGNLLRPLGMYHAAVRELGASLCVPVADLGEWSAARWRRAGDTGSRACFAHLEPGEHPAHPDGLRDNTHLRERGAVECARFVAAELKRQGLLTPEHFRELDTPVPLEAVPYAESPDDLGLR